MLDRDKERLQNGGEMPKEMKPHRRKWLRWENG